MLEIQGTVGSGLVQVLGIGMLQGKIEEGGPFGRSSPKASAGS